MPNSASGLSYHIHRGLLYLNTVALIATTYATIMEGSHSHFPLHHDIIFIVSEYLNEDSLNSLCRVNKNMQMLLEQRLYRHNAKYHCGTALRWAASKGLMRPLKMAVEAIMKVDMESWRDEENKWWPTNHMTWDNELVDGAGTWNVSDIREDSRYYTSKTFVDWKPCSAGRREGYGDRDRPDCPQRCSRGEFVAQRWFAREYRQNQDLSALGRACESGDLEIVQYLFGLGAEPDPDAMHHALVRAMIRGNEEVCRFLLGTLGEDKECTLRRAFAEAAACTEPRILELVLGMQELHKIPAMILDATREILYVPWQSHMARPLLRKLLWFLKRSDEATTHPEYNEDDLWALQQQSDIIEQETLSYHDNPLRLLLSQLVTALGYGVAHKWPSPESFDKQIEAMYDVLRDDRVQLRHASHELRGSCSVPSLADIPNRPVGDRFPWLTDAKWKVYLESPTGIRFGLAGLQSVEDVRDEWVIRVEKLLYGRPVRSLPDTGSEDTCAKLIAAAVVAAEQFGFDAWRVIYPSCNLPEMPEVGPCDHFRDGSWRILVGRIKCCQHGCRKIVDVSLRCSWCGATYCLRCDRQAEKEGTERAAGNLRRKRRSTI